MRYRYHQGSFGCPFSAPVLKLWLPSATVLEVDDFRRKPKIYQLCGATIVLLSFSVQSSETLTRRPGVPVATHSLISQELLGGSLSFVSKRNKQMYQTKQSDEPIQTLRFSIGSKLLI